MKKGILMGIVIALVIVAALAGFWYWTAAQVGPQYAAPLDWASFEKTPKPNQYLVAPEGRTKAEPDRTAPVYDKSAADLRADLLAVIYAEPKREIIWESEDGAEFVVEQRSKLMNYPDYISVRLIDLGDGQSSLMLYSRSHFGYSDMGVNQDRVERWLAGIEAAGG